MDKTQIISRLSTIQNELEAYGNKKFLQSFNSLSELINKTNKDPIWSRINPSEFNKAFASIRYCCKLYNYSYGHHTGHLECAIETLIKEFKKLDN